MLLVSVSCDGKKNKLKFREVDKMDNIVELIKRNEQLFFENIEELV